MGFGLISEDQRVQVISKKRRMKIATIVGRFLLVIHYLKMVLIS